MTVVWSHDIGDAMSPRPIGDGSPGSQTPGDLSQEPSMTKNSSSSRAGKIRAPRDSTPLGGVRKLAQKCAEKAPSSKLSLSSVDD